jgi:hypothetical protein
LLVALLLAGALLAALPALAGGLPLLARDRVDGPIAVLDPGTTASNDGVQAPLGNGAAPPSAADPDPGDGRGFDGGGDDRDQNDDDSSGPGRSGGGSGGGGSSGPG